MYCAQGTSHSTKTFAASTKNAIAFVTCFVFSRGKSSLYVYIRTYLAILGLQILFFLFLRISMQSERNFDFDHRANCVRRQMHMRFQVAPCACTKQTRNVTDAIHCQFRLHCVVLCLQNCAKHCCRKKMSYLWIGKRNSCIEFCIE